MMNKYLSNQKLWKIIRQPEGFYYEIKLAGVIIDRVKIDSPAYDILKREGLIDDCGSH
jgi:hypothetical protein